jgi:chromosome segregation ATPase
MSRTSFTSEISQRTTQFIPGAFEGDTTIIQDSTDGRQRGLGQTEPSLRERLSRAQKEAAGYKECARQYKYQQGQYAHRLIQAEERLTICTTEKSDLEDQVTELQRRIIKLEDELSQADNMRSSAFPKDQLLVTLRQENA